MVLLPTPLLGSNRRRGVLGHVDVWPDPTRSYLLPVFHPPIVCAVFITTKRVGVCSVLNQRSCGRVQKVSTADAVFSHFCSTRHVVAWPGVACLVCFSTFVTLAIAILVVP